MDATHVVEEREVDGPSHAGLVVTRAAGSDGPDEASLPVVRDGLQSHVDVALGVGPFPGEGVACEVGGGAGANRVRQA